MALALVLNPTTTTAGQTFTATSTSTPAVAGEPITFVYDAQPNQIVNADATGVAVATFTATTTGPVVATGATSGTASAVETVTAAPNCVITVTSSPANPTVGQPVTLTAHVTCNGVEVTGAVVSFSTPNGTFIGITAAGIGAVVNIGALPLGGNPVTATVVGFTGVPPTCLCLNTSVTTTVTVVAAPSTCQVTLTASPTTATPGQTVTLTATVTCNGAPVSGATVVFTGPGGLSFSGTTNASGVSTTTTTTLPNGTNTITATVTGPVGGTCTCTNVIATTTVTVGAAQTFTAQPACYTLNFPPLPWSFAHTTLTATGATPGAVVTFHQDGAGGPVLCTAVADANGNASCTANLSVFQVLTPTYTATTPVAGGFLTSSSTLLPCL
ncbi:Ig-like domain repeat protein [Streptomyces sp. TM32]|uniref:Ig-like domain repeat protein n=1 Tax=Streptomyces sp. TM32 TaxID=1652669 RepID=UPI00101320A6|nr:Ig-like domain repeat protein [Streptomyces sp. TM32]RXS73786.1 Ig-like domain repeat protein [Streptomyces sp. TM32]